MPESPSSVFVLHSGLVLKGQLSMVKDIVLTGKFEGELQTLGCLTVTSGGAVTGSIDAGGLILEPGNLVEAKVRVGQQPKAAGRLSSPTAGEPLFQGWKRRIQKLKEFALGRA